MTPLLRALTMAAAALASTLAPRPVAAGQPIAITDVTVIDVAQGRRIGPRTILVADGRIAAMGARDTVTIPADAARIDGTGRFLVPGLVDLHVHLFNNASHRPPNDWAFALFVANGVTGVREMASRPEQIAQVSRWREAVTHGERIAPYVLAAGVPVHGPSAEAARAQVRAVKLSGADFIKVFSELPPPAWRAVLAEARRLRIPVAGHVPAAVSLAQAAAAGQRSAEHLMQAYEACSTIEERVLGARAADPGRSVDLRDQQEADVLRNFSTPGCARAARAVAGTHLFQVPTLVLPHAESRRGADLAADPRWRYLRADEQARWRRLPIETSAGDRELATLRWDVSCRIVRVLHAGGVAILAGTDAPMPEVYPGYSLHDELELLVACGLSSAEALRAATLGAAQFLGLERTSGTIDAGKRADLVLLAADPLLDIANLRRIDAVVLAGRWLTRAQLDATLAQPAARPGG